MRIEHMTGGARLKLIEPYRDPNNRLLWCYECRGQREELYRLVWLNKSNQEVIFTLCPICLINYLAGLALEEVKK